MSNSSDWYDEGAHAYVIGAGLFDNPYEENTEPHDRWIEGWLSRKDKEMEKLTHDRAQ